MKIFPNPASSLINLAGDAQKNDNTTFQIIDNNGTIVFSGTLSDPQINVEYLSAGKYHVLLRKNNSKFKGSFLKM
ncbi:MAG: hypothetical protein ACJA1A_000652 [Saprospiraceae bacterium]